jgi:ribose/xylose/arabinose/galactoside ABC-type transport system permease subunit
MIASLNNIERKPMNRKQKCILGLGTACFIVAGLFPPWIETIRVGQIYKRVALPWTGCSILQSPLPTNERFAQFTSIEIDTSRLAIIWVVTILLTGFAWWITNESPGSAQKS